MKTRDGEATGKVEDGTGTTPAAADAGDFVAQTADWLVNMFSPGNSARTARDQDQVSEAAPASDEPPTVEVEAEAEVAPPPSDDKEVAAAAAAATAGRGGDGEQPELGSGGGKAKQKGAVDVGDENDAAGGGDPDDGAACGVELRGGLEGPRVIFRAVPNQRHDEQEHERKLRALPTVEGRPVGQLAYADNSSPLIASRDLDLIRVILRDHGYARAPIKPGTVLPVDDWCLFWYANDLQPDALKLLSTLRPYQRINKLPGSQALTNKTNLWRCFARMQEEFGAGAFGFMPLSFVLPAQLDVCEAFLKERAAKRGGGATGDDDERDEEEEDGRDEGGRGGEDEEEGGGGGGGEDEVYILKPNTLSRGHGISLYRPGPESGWGASWDSSFARVRSHTGLLSSYIHPPMLLGGLKFDMRLYVLVTSACPLCVYTYVEGLTRFATEKYDITSIENRFQHLTNYSLNKKSKSFVKTTSQSLDDDGVGSKWSLGAFRRRLVAEVGEARAAQVWRDVDDVLLKTVIAAEPTFCEQAETHLPAFRRRESPRLCFQLFGFDVMVRHSRRSPCALGAAAAPSRPARVRAAVCRALGSPMADGTHFSLFRRPDAQGFTLLTHAPFSRLARVCLRLRTARCAAQAMAARGQLRPGSWNGAGA